MESIYSTNYKNLSVKRKRRIIESTKPILYIIIGLGIFCHVSYLYSRHPLSVRIHISILFTIIAWFIFAIREMSNNVTTILKVKHGKLVYNNRPYCKEVIKIPIDKILSVEGFSKYNKRYGWNQSIHVCISDQAAEAMTEREIACLRKEPEKKQMRLKMTNMCLSEKEHLQLVKDLQALIKKD